MVTPAWSIASLKPCMIRVACAMELETNRTARLITVLSASKNGATCADLSLQIRKILWFRSTEPTHTWALCTRWGQSHVSFSIGAVLVSPTNNATWYQSCYGLLSVYQLYFCGLYWVCSSWFPYLSPRLLKPHLKSWRRCIVWLKCSLFHLCSLASGFLCLLASSYTTHSSLSATRFTW